jgi:gentisate 1,2-dioxygenase
MLIICTFQPILAQENLTAISPKRSAPMSSQLGTLEELPQDYRDAMGRAGVAPLWPQMRNVLPHNAPQPVTRAHLWSYAAVRPLLLRAGELTPVEKAERRVLFLADPGRGAGAMQATSTIYVGLQLLLPGETAPAHRHTPSAARIAVEGDGAYTVVDGEKLPMKNGDLILTPGGCWHDHGHSGNEPVVWLDALDLPLFVYLEGSYAVEAPLQSPRNRPDPSEVEYRAAGLLPSRRRDNALPPAFPMMRYPWSRTEAALRNLAEHGGEDAVELDYINPETGQSCLPTLGFTAMLLRANKSVRPVKRSSSAVFHAVSGKGVSRINGQRIAWQAKDTFSAPVFAAIEHEAGDEAAFLMRIHDGPLQEKLGFYEERSE